ncbi:hypothetical protein LUZ60_014529 [Juncus effusus]|nr:hypothetical protein LUZ60_014529 [Juncus effusus]
MKHKYVVISKERVLRTCSSVINGYLTGISGFCTTEHDSECCQDGQQYPQYDCSPPVTTSTSAIKYISSFTQGSDDGGASACDRKYHNDNESVVSLSTGWFNDRSRCLKNIRINGNGNSVLAKVVDECDSVNGCTRDLNVGCDLVRQTFQLGFEWIFLWFHLCYSGVRILGVDELIEKNDEIIVY